MIVMSATMENIVEELAPKVKARKEAKMDAALLKKVISLLMTPEHRTFSRQNEQKLVLMGEEFELNTPVAIELGTKLLEYKEAAIRVMDERVSSMALSVAKVAIREKKENKQEEV